MKKSEPAAIKTDGSVKEAPVVLLRTVLEPEKKPALKTEAKAGADKPEDPAADSGIISNLTTPPSTSYDLSPSTQETDML